MRAGPTVAVVVPARDAGPFVERALASVLAQRRPPDEVIVVDDGSADDTAERVRALGAGPMLLTTPGVGVARARAEGVAAARSDFVAFLDADDHWDPGHLERMCRAIRETEGRAAVYFSDMRLAPGRGGGTIWGHCGLSIAEPWELWETDKSWLFAKRQPIPIQGSLVRRSTYLEVGGCDLGLVRRSDTHVLFKLGLAGPLCAVAGIAGDWTTDNDRSLTRTYLPEHGEYVACTVALYEDLLRRRPQLERAQRRVLAGRAVSARLTLAARSSPPSAARHLVRAFRLAPLAALADVAGRARRKLAPPQLDADPEPGTATPGVSQALP